MASTLFSIKSATVGSLGASQEIDTLRSRKQIDDAFYVPGDEAFVVITTTVNTPSTDGSAPTSRQVAPRIVVCKLDPEGNPLAAEELYIGQVVKLDVHGVVAFNNELAKALRQSGDKFKKMILGKILQIAKSKTIDDRKWDKDKWARDENGNYIVQQNTAYDFAVVRPAFTDDKIKSMNKMILDYVKENYSELVEVTEE